MENINKNPGEVEENISEVKDSAAKVENNEAKESNELEVDPPKNNRIEESNEPDIDSLEPANAEAKESAENAAEVSTDVVNKTRKDFLNKKIEEYEKKRKDGESLSDRENFLLITNILYSEPKLNEPDENGITIASELVKKLRNISMESESKRKDKIKEFVERVKNIREFEEIKIGNSNARDIITENISSAADFLEMIREKSIDNVDPGNEIYKNLGNIEKSRSRINSEKAGTPSEKGIEFIANYETLLDMYDKPEDREIISRAFNTAAKNQGDSLDLKEKIEDIEEKLSRVQKTPETAAGNSAEVAKEAAMVGATAAAVAFPPALIVMCFIYLLYHNNRDVQEKMDSVGKKIGDKVGKFVGNFEKLEREKQENAVGKAIASAREGMNENKLSFNSSVPSDLMPFLPVNEKQHTTNGKFSDILKNIKPSNEDNSALKIERKGGSQSMSI
ncbi:MAG: hypothetical protein LBB13_00900 [Rickettsiales bacterium]|jgi:hypothetical protein|nr:hypothetical protein [Rickettsiales bacterium]